MADNPIVERRQAMLNDIHLVAVEPGTKIFDTATGVETFLGIVYNKHPVINGRTCYLSNDDYDDAKAAVVVTGGIVKKSRPH